MRDVVGIVDGIEAASKHGDLIRSCGIHAGKLRCFVEPHVLDCMSCPRSLRVRGGRQRINRPLQSGHFPAIRSAVIVVRLRSPRED